MDEVVHAFGFCFCCGLGMAGSLQRVVILCLQGGRIDQECLCLYFANKESETVGPRGADMNPETNYR